MRFAIPIHRRLPAAFSETTLQIQYNSHSMKNTVPPLRKTTSNPRLARPLKNRSHHFATTCSAANEVEKSPENRQSAILKNCFPKLQSQYTIHHSQFS